MLLGAVGLGIPMGVWTAWAMWDLLPISWMLVVTAVLVLGGAGFGWAISSPPEET
jgi:hypothetical protein